MDDAATDTMVELYVVFGPLGRVAKATFRTFGCSACIAASSVATELLTAHSQAPTADDLEVALGGLPPDKRYCLEIVAQAAAKALSSRPLA